MGKHTNGRGIYVDPLGFWRWLEAISKKIAAQAIVGATLHNEHGKGEEEGEERTGGIQKGKQKSPVPLLKPPGDTFPQTRRAYVSGSYTQNSKRNPYRHKNITRIHMSADNDKQPLTCQNKQVEKSLTLTHVPPKHTEARTTNDTTMTERIRCGGGGGGKPHVEKDKAGQTTSQDRRDEPIVTKEQKDKLNDDEEREGEEQSKRKRKGESAEFSFGAEKESRAKLDAESDEASGHDDNADFMKVNDEQPIEEFCKAITPTISAYKKFEPLYSEIRGLVVVNDAPAPAGEERVGKWSASMKVRRNAQYLLPHILMSEAKWAEVLDTNPISMWFGTNKNDSSLIRVIKFYWKSQAARRQLCSRRSSSSTTKSYCSGRMRQGAS